MFPTQKNVMIQLRGEGQLKGDRKTDKGLAFVAKSFYPIRVVRVWSLMRENFVQRRFCYLNGMRETKKGSIEETRA